MNLFKKKIPLVSSLILSLGLVACSDVDTLLNTIVLPTTIEVSPSGIEVTNQEALSENSLSQAAGPAISGGSPDLPVELNLSKRHAISSNLSTNYFKYTVVVIYIIFLMVTFLTFILKITILVVTIDF